MPERAAVREERGGKEEEKEQELGELVLHMRSAFAARRSAALHPFRPIRDCIEMLSCNTPSAQERGTNTPDTQESCSLASHRAHRSAAELRTPRSEISTLASFSAFPQLSEPSSLSLP
jgi:molybdopterin converting factor small subunit